MAAYDTRTTLPMLDAVTRAREFFEMKCGFAAEDRLGALYRWRDPASSDVIEMRSFPIRGGGTRLEIDTRYNDDVVLKFIQELPRPGLLEEWRNRWRGDT